MRKAIITVNLGGYDPLVPTWVFEGWENFYFTDDQSAIDEKKTLGWHPIKVDLKGVSPEIKAREIKILTHRILPEHDMYCYMDGNMSLKHPPPAKNIRIQHPLRNCVHEEIEAIKQWDKKFSGDLSKDLEKIKEMPKDYGLFSNGFFIRDRSWDKIHDAWWEEYISNPTRDQISLPLVMWSAQIKIGQKKGKPYIRNPKSEIWTWDKMTKMVNYFAK